MIMMSAHIHTGTCGAQNCNITAAAVNSDGILNAYFMLEYSQ
jgi:hypothetical protein